MQYAIQTWEMRGNTLRELVAFVSSAGEQIQREPLWLCSVFIGDGAGNLTQFFFITSKQDNGRAVACIGKRGFTPDAITGSGDQNNAIL